MRSKEDTLPTLGLVVQESAMPPNYRESSVLRGDTDFCEHRKVTYREAELMRAHVSEGRAKRLMDLGKSGKWGSLDAFIRSYYF